MVNKNDLAKIHIAKKALGLDDDTYRTAIRDIGKCKSGSAKDLSDLGMARVLQHFRNCGWKPTKKKKGPVSRRPAKNKSFYMASDAQIKMIRSIWIKMAEQGTVRHSDEQSLRAWIKSATRRSHPIGVGYDAPEFLPAGVAQAIIEHLKKWAARSGVVLKG